MKSFDYVRLAFQNILRQKLRSALTIFAVVIGATSVTIMLAIVTGAKTFVQSQFEASGVLQQVVVTQATDLDYDQARHGGGGGPNAGGVKLDDALEAKIKNVEHVTGVASSTYINAFDAMTYNGKKLSVQNTTAFEPNGVITHTMLAGRDLQPNDGNGVITITQPYADKFGFAHNYGALVGKQVTLTTNTYYTGDGADVPQPPVNGPGNNSPNGPTGKATDFQATIVGIVSAEGGDATVSVPMSWGRGLSLNRHWEASQQQTQRSVNSKVSSPPPPPKMTLVTESQIDQNGYQTLTVKVDQTKNVEKVAGTIRSYGVGAATAKTFVQQQLQVLNIVGVVLGSIGGIALLVASVGVVNTMIMAILERTREIGVMRACGATRAAVRRLFTFEAALLGFWGGAFGLAAGYGLTRVANVFLNRQLKDNGLSTSNIITLPLWLILAVLAATTLIGWLAGLYPAARAARLNPVEALRYE